VSKRGQRGAQLVRHVRDDRPVSVYQRLEPPRHRVERGAQAAQLRRSRADLGPDREIAVGQPAGRGVQALQRPAHPPGQAERQQRGGDHRHRGDRPEDDPQRQDLVVQRLGGPGQEHRTDHCVFQGALPDDGHRHDHVRSRELRHRLDWLVRQYGGGLDLPARFADKLIPVTGRHGRIDLVLTAAGQHEQAVTALPRLLDHRERGELGLRGRLLRNSEVLRPVVLGDQDELVLGQDRVRAGRTRRSRDERGPVVRGRVEGQRHHRADQHDGGERQQREQDPPGHW
jgi:hypothetical protein